MPKLSPVLQIGVHEAEIHEKNLIQEVAWCLEEMLRKVGKNYKDFRLVPSEPGKRMIDRMEHRKAYTMALHEDLTPEPT